MLVASIDIGTNSVRLLIGEVSQGQFRVRTTRLVTTRLGQGVNQGKITEEAMARTLAALQKYADLIQQAQVERTWVVATSAVRDANSRQEFIDLMENQTGLKIEVISGEQEAQLGYLGVTAGIPSPTGTYILDIGGGSTELVTQNQEQIFGVSLQVGAVRMTEGGHSFAGINQLITSGYHQLPVQPQALIGVGGTITTLAAIAQNLQSYEPAKVHGYELTSEVIDGIYQRLSNLTLEERKMVAGLQPQRADIIVAGILILKATLAHLGINKIIVSEADLLVGLPRFHGLNFNQIDFSGLKE